MSAPLSVWPSPSGHSLYQRLHTSEAKRQRSGTLAPPAPRLNMQPIPALRFAVCQWICVAEHPWPRCGAPTRDGGAWCAEHHRIVFQQPDAETPMP